MYWACKVLAEFRNSIRFRVNGISYYVPSLLFRWSFSPIIAIETLAHYLSLQPPNRSSFVCKTINLKLFFTKLHISNMYWACKVLAQLRYSIRFRANGISYYVTSLPFRWSFNPIIAIETLAHYLSLQPPDKSSRPSI